jgi:hypothetical protein
VYRIIGIEYEFSNGGVTNLTHLTIIPDAQFSAYLNIDRTFTDTISEMRTVARDELRKLGSTEAGTVTEIDGTTVTVMTERGIIKVARDAA